MLDGERMMHVAMSPMVRKFLKASLVYLFLGVTLGALLAIAPVRNALFEVLPGRWNLIHAHLNLLGFVSFMIFGVAYHIVPRFSGFGAEPWSPRLVEVHFWAANVGLWLFLAGFALAPFGWLNAAGGLVLLLSVYLFIFNLWKTMSATEAGSLLPMVHGPVPRKGAAAR